LRKVNSGEKKEKDLGIEGGKEISQRVGKGRNKVPAVLVQVESEKKRRRKNKDKSTSRKNVTVRVRPGPRRPKLPKGRQKERREGCQERRSTLIGKFETTLNVDREERDKREASVEGGAGRQGEGGI